MRPRTAWDKSNPQIANYLREHQIDSYSFKSGDILNMTYASASDLSKKLNDDRWREDETARAAKRIE